MNVSAGNKVSALVVCESERYVETITLFHGRVDKLFPGVGCNCKHTPAKRRVTLKNARTRSRLNSIMMVFIKVDESQIGPVSLSKMWQPQPWPPYCAYFSFVAGLFGKFLSISHLSHAITKNVNNMKYLKLRKCSLSLQNVCDHILVYTFKSAYFLWYSFCLETSHFFCHNLISKYYIKNFHWF